MIDEIEAIKYIMSNISTQKRILKEIKDKKELKDNVYDYTRYILREYSRYYLSLKRMLDNRTKRNEKANNIVIEIAGTIAKNSLKLKNNDEILNFLKEACKINILDLKNVQNVYKIKGKNIKNLIAKLIKFEEENLDKINMYLLEQ